MKLSEILPQLTQPFEPHEHRERALPGGGRWWFIPWQTIRARLNEVCPDDWTAEYSDPVVAADHIVIRCKLTICGVVREGVGNDKAYPDRQTYGTPIERAVADAFKAAAEAFDIASYLDEQSQDKRNFTIRYLQSKGDGRALKAARENGWVEGNLPSSDQRKQQRQQQAQTQVDQIRQQNYERPITEAQIKRLSTIATQAGYSLDGLKALLAAHGYATRKQVLVSDYDEICRKAGDSELAEVYNRNTTIQAG